MKYQTPDAAIDGLAKLLATVCVQSSTRQQVGRILAQDIVADRDSPAADVSAMDGYAIRVSDLKRSGPIPVRGESSAGGPPPEMQSGSIVRIFTGAVIPDGCEAVVRREDTKESDREIVFLEAAITTRAGDNIRRAGENAKMGGVVVNAGTKVTAATAATMTSVGAYQADLYAPVRVIVLTTGDEVGRFENESPKPWQLRNSNRDSIVSFLSAQPWIDVVEPSHCHDDRDVLTRSLADCLQRADAVLVSGGVSKGDYDYVPDVIRENGAEIVFHGLPIRPGKPILGAATSGGKLILGLPGNPVSAIVGAKRFAEPLLAKMSGQTDWKTPRPILRLKDFGDKTLPLVWMRLVRIVGQGVCELVPSQGSGDLVSLGQSSGFVEIPRGESGEGPWPFYAW
ncbi:Molybdopterin molybdenumtransferase [Planctomycetes bacterium CA13]|uniref:Molybdopterin molybdenumtransferase n=1 Tax=Novipirellula herctigrandis TaxID=2527986 RepID=A0A5C5Z0T3_9BACT|nr:Molybdopterin molybdenumtransferase [Planctomycetes bacterium CA13]